jgi:hypothetical protein
MKKKKCSGSLVGFLRPTGIGLSSTNQRPYKKLSGRQGIVMNSLGVRQHPTRIGRRRVVRDSRRKGLNPQDLRTMENILEGAFLLEVYINKIPPLKVEINIFRQSNQRPIT